MDSRRIRLVLTVICMFGLLSLAACDGSSSSAPAIIDTDGDGVANASDNCLLIPNADQADADQNGVGDACEGDTDGDGIPDATDNCPPISNPGQEDANIDGIGDVCSVDTDVDGIFDFLDNCPADANTDQADSDNDGVGDVCDNCPVAANADQTDADGDGSGDVCDVTPNPAADTFNWIGNTTLTIAAPGLLTNDPAGTLITDPDTRATLDGGSVTVNADGSFTYEPRIGAQNVADRFTYSITGGLTATVTVNLVERVWYVDNNPGPSAPAPDGSNDAPFTSLAAVVGGDLNDTIFVFTGDGTSTGQNAGIALLTGQKLIGQGAGLLVNGEIVVAATPLAPPLITNAPAVGGAPDQPVVTLVDNNEVAGISFQSTAVEAMVRGIGISGFSIHDNTFTNSQREDVLLVNASGTGSVMDNSMTGSLRNGIRFTNNDAGVATPADITASVTFSGNTITVDANGREGIDVDLTSVTATSVTLTASGNTINGSGAGNDGLRMQTAGGAVLVATLDLNEINNADDQGFDVDTLGNSRIDLVLTGSTITGSTNEGIDLQSNLTSTLNARVNGNTLTGNGGVNAGLQAASQANSAFCMELTSNTSDNGFDVNGASAVPLQFIVAGNTPAAIVGGTTVAGPAGGCVP